MRIVLKMSILSRFRNQSNFARACGKNDNWLSRIIMGRQDPTDEERRLIRNTLGVDDEIKNLFSCFTETRR